MKTKGKEETMKNVFYGCNLSCEGVRVKLTASEHNRERAPSSDKSCYMAGGNRVYYGHLFFLFMIVICLLNAGLM